MLDLSWNNIRGKGAQIIGEALRKNCSLKVLDLSWNGFGDEGVAAVCEALSVNDCLEEIDLTSNRITTQGARAFAKALGVNTGLQVVRLGKNSFKWTFALEIVKAAVRNEEGSAQEFYFDDMPVTKQFEEALEEIVASYPDLVVQCGTSLRGKAREKKKRRKRVSISLYTDTTYIHCRQTETDKYGRHHRQAGGYYRKTDTTGRQTRQEDRQTD